MNVPTLEKTLGIEIYATNSDGIGGVIKQKPEDFVVEEILVDGSKAEVLNLGRSEEKPVLGSASTKSKYSICVLVKRNWDTFMALHNVATKLGISPMQIHIGGIKDAKATTAQYVTIEGVSIENLRGLDLKDLEIRPIGYVRHKLSSFYLQGNHFRIRIRNVHHTKRSIEKRIVETIRQLNELKGVPNFFGHQRFGTKRPITHCVGKAIIKGKLKQAAMLFLAKPSPYEHPLSRDARKELSVTQDFKKALNRFPKQLRYERAMLRSLADKPDDFLAAFKRIPIRLRRIFVQAYQSYLFNRFLSARIEHGFSLISAEVGDYVMSIDRLGLPVPMIHKTVNLENRIDINSAIETGKLRLALPLVGIKQRSSSGVQGDIEHRILQDEDVSSDEFKIPSISEMSSRGELRAMITPVKYLNWNHESDPKKSNCLNIGFQLSRGSYATVILREFMKPRSLVNAGF